MPLDTYAGLQTAILQGLARPDDPMVAPAIPDLIRLFEAEARRRLKSGGNEHAAFINTVAGQSTIDLPEDCGEIRAADIMSVGLTDIQPLKFLAPQSSSPGLNSSGRPAFYTVFGNASRTGRAVMRLVPVPDAVYTVGLNYLRDLPPLSPTAPTNWLLESAPDLYYFGALVEAEMYVGHDERVTMWLQRRDLAFASIEKADIKARWSGPLQLRADGITIAGISSSGGGSGGGGGNGNGGGGGDPDFPVDATGAAPWNVLHFLSPSWVPTDPSLLVTRATGGLQSRTLAHRWGDAINIRDYAFGDGSVETSSIAAFFAAAHSHMGPQNPIAIPATARSAYLPGGLYKSAQTTVPLVGVGWSVSGEGRLTQLQGVKLRTASQNQTISNMRFLDSASRTNTGIEIGYIMSTISNVEVRDFLVGIHCDGADLTAGGIGGGLITDCMTNYCNTGVLIDAKDQRLVGNRISEHSTAGVKFTDGGGIHMVSNWVQGIGPSLVIEGDGAGHNPYESYFYLNTFTNDTDQYYREYGIASMASADADEHILLTLATPSAHELMPGLGGVNLFTGNPEYDAYGTYILDVLSTTQIILGRHFIGNATGTFRVGGFDLIINTATDPSQVRNLRFIGNNTNHTKLNGGANLSFFDRLKTQIWMGGGVNQPNNVMFFKMPDAEYAGGAQIDPPTNNVKNTDVRPSGPGSLIGYGEIGMLRTGSAGYTAGLGGLKMGHWVPFTEGGFTNHGLGNMPEYYNGMETLNTLCRITSLGVDHNIQGTNWGVRDPRVWDIASIVSANAGASILVTLRTNARITAGVGFVRLSATGVTGYNGEWAIEAAPAVNQVQLAVAYVSDVGAVGTVLPVGRSINFREGGVGGFGTPGNPTGLDFTMNVSAFRGVSDDTVFGNAIFKFHAPVSTTPAGETRTGGFIVVPGNPVNSQRSLFIGAPVGNPNLFGDAASIRALTSPSLEIRNDGVFQFWPTGETESLARIAGVPGLDSYLNLHQNTGTVFRLSNNNGGTAASAALEVRNSALTATATVRVEALGVGFATAGIRVQDGGAVYSDTSLSGGLSVAALAGNLRLSAAGEILCDIPAADPGIPGALYHTAGAVRVSL